MAQGDVTIYEKFLERLGDGEINLSTAIVSCIITSDTTGALPGGGAGATDPRYGAGGSQDIGTNEVAAGGGYATGGVTIDGADPWANNAGTMEYTGQNAAWTSSASGDPTNCNYGVFFVDAGGTVEYAIGYVQVYDGATSVSLLAGDVTIKWNGGATEGIVFTLA